MKNITLIFILTTNFLQGQLETIKDTIYINEQKKLSTKDLTLKKCKSDVFFCELIEYDSIIAYHTYMKYIFGSIDKEKMRHYQNIIRKKMGISLDTNSILVIDYRKHLTDYKSYKNFVDSLRNDVSDKDKIRLMEKKAYDSNKKRFFSKLKKCSKRIKRNNGAIPIYMYGVNLASDMKVVYFNKMVKDYKNVFANDFFNEKGLYKLLILKPNGDYFLKSAKSSQNDFSEKDVFNLLKSQNWERYHKEWDNRLMRLNRSVSRIRVMMDYYKPENSCF